MAGCDENNNRFLAMPGYGQDYGSKEARLALAISDTGGNGSSSPTDISSGIDGSTDIDTILNRLDTINNNLQHPLGGYIERIGNVGTSSVILAASSASRTAVQIQNTSGVNLYIRFGNAATTTTGFRIKPDGMFYSQLKQQVTQSVNIVSEAANSPYVGFTIE